LAHSEKPTARFKRPRLFIFLQEEQKYVLVTNSNHYRTHDFYERLAVFFGVGMLSAVLMLSRRA